MRLMHPVEKPLLLKFKLQMGDDVYLIIYYAEGDRSLAWCHLFDDHKVTGPRPGVTFS